jgi:outer membrane protein assembly factor BamD
MRAGCASKPMLMDCEIKMSIGNKQKKGRSVSFFLTLILLMGLAFSFFSCSKREKVLTDQELYNRAMDYMGREKYLRAGEFLDRMEEEYPESSLMAKARLNRADIHFRLTEFDEARAEYERFLNLHPVHAQADLARFRVAMTYFEQILSLDRDQTSTIRALEALERFIKEYPKSPFIPEAREKVSICRLRLAEQDLYVARFYIKTGSYQAARGRLQKIWRLYPEIPWRDEVLYLLSQTYEMEGMVDEAVHVRCQIYKQFPESPFTENIQDSCPDIGS